MNGKRTIFFVCMILITLAVGFWIGSSFVDAGVRRFESQDQESAVARKALQNAQWFVPESLGIFAPLALSLRVESVERIEGSCRQLPPEGQEWEAVANYRAIVRAYTLFALPFRRYEVTCGGTSIRSL